MIRRKEKRRKKNQTNRFFFIVLFLLGGTVSTSPYKINYLRSYSFAEAAKALQQIKAEHNSPLWAYPTSHLQIDEKGKLEDDRFSYFYLFEEEPFSMTLEEMTYGMKQKDEYWKTSEGYILSREGEETVLVEESEVERIKKDNFDLYFGFEANEELDNRIEILSALASDSSGLTSFSLIGGIEGQLDVELQGEVRRGSSLQHLRFHYEDFFLTLYEIEESSNVLSSNYSFSFEIS